MRFNVLLIAIFLATGVFVARYADRAVHPVSRTEGNEANTATRSSSVITIQSPAEVEIAQSGPPQNNQNRLPEIIKLAPTSRAVTLRSDRSGHFKVEARADGRRIEFLVDTGASAVALRASDAARLNIHPSESQYTVKTITANGTGKAAIARINMIEIENIVVRDVLVLVHPDKMLSENLLGMTFLSKIRWTYDHGKLVLDQ